MASIAALACALTANAARADVYAFLGSQNPTPGYGAHPEPGINGCNCGVGVPDTYNFTLIGDIFSPSSYLNSAFIAPPGPNDTIVLGGLPPGSDNPVDGPPLPSPPFTDGKDPTNGQVAPAYIGYGGFQATGSGTVGFLNVAASGVLSPGQITVINALALEGVGDQEVIQTGYTPSMGVFPILTGQFFPGNLTISGGSIASQGTVDIAADSDNAAYPGTVEIKGSTITGDIVRLFTSGNTSNITIDNGGQLIANTTMSLLVDPNVDSFPNYPPGQTTVLVNGGSITAGGLNIGVLVTSPSPPAGASASLDVSNGNVTVTDSYLAVGYQAPGTLDIHNGSHVTVSDDLTYISLIPGSGNSSLTVDGSGTTFTDNKSIYVGTNDVGNMTISNNAQVTSGDIFVVGLNSTGVGTLTISSGGSLTSDSLEGAGYLSGDVGANPGAVGNVTITGAGSIWESKQSFADAVEGTGNVTISDGGELKVDGLQLRVGRDGGSNGTLTLTGSGSMIVAPNATFYDGFGGTGLVTLGAGTTTQVGGIDIGGKDEGGNIGNGVLNLTGAGATLTVVGSSTVNLPMVVIGDAGRGQLTVSQGASLDLSGAAVDIGAQAGSNGALIVDSSNAASNIKLGSQAIIGDAGTGSLQITGSGPGDQSSITLNDHLLIGNQPGSMGSVAITNATLDVGSAQADGSLILGYQGAGLIDVNQGGALISAGFMLGSHDQGSGTISLNDASATASVSGDTGVGTAQGGTGEIDLSKGSMFTTQTLTVAGVNGATGTVDDSGGNLTVNGALNIGGDQVNSTANVNLHDGASVTAQDVSVSSQGGTANLTLTGASTSLSFSTLSIHAGGVVDINQATATGTNPLNFLGGSTDVSMDGGKLTVENGGTLSAPVVSADFGATLNFTGASSFAHIDYLTVHSSDPAFQSSLNISSKLSAAGGIIQLTDTATTVTSGGNITAGQIFIDTTLSGSTNISGATVNVIGPIFGSGTCCNFTVAGDGAFTVSGSNVQINGGFSTSSSSSKIDSDPTFQVTGDFDVNQGGSLTVDNSSVVTVSGGAVNISSGSLTLDHGSSLVMAGSNGTVNIVAPGSMLTVQNGAQLQSVNTVNVGTENGGTFAAHGSIVFVAKQVAVTLGTIDVTGGALWIGSGPAGGPSVTVNGQTYSNSYVYVGSGGVLSGVGTIDGSLVVQGGVNAGVFHVGDDPGTFTITGDYVQAAGGQTEIEVGPNSYSQIVVGGKAILDGGTIVLQSVDGGKINVGQQYDFIQASGGITGQVGSIEAPGGFTTLSPDIVDGTLVLQAVHVAGSFRSLAVTPNEQALAGALDRAGMDTSSPIVPLVNAISQENPADLPATFEALSPEGLVGAQDAVFGAQHGFVSAVVAAAQDLGTQTAASGQTTVVNGVGRIWSTGFYANGQIAGQPAEGLVGVDTQGGGFAVGGDRPVGGHGLIGFSIGVSGDSFSAPGRATRGTLTGAHAAVYGGFTLGGFYANGLVSYGHFSDDAYRTVAAAGFSGRFSDDDDSDLVGGRLEVGWRLRAGAFAVAPFAAVEGDSLFLHDASEAAVGGDSAILAITAPAQTVGSALVSVGVNADTHFDIGGVTIIPSLQLAYSRAVVDQRQLSVAFESAPSSLFTAEGVAPGQDSAHAALGLDAQFHNGVRLFAQAQTDQGRADHVDAGYLGVRVDW